MSSAIQDCAQCQRCGTWDQKVNLVPVCGVDICHDCEEGNATSARRVRRKTEAEEHYKMVVPPIAKSWPTPIEYKDANGLLFSLRETWHVTRHADLWLMVFAGSLLLLCISIVHALSQ